MNNEKLTYEQLKSRCEYYEEALSLIREESEKERELQKNPVDFDSAATPLILYLRKNHHPHVTAIIDSGHAELLEGIKVVNKLTQPATK